MRDLAYRSTVSTAFPPFGTGEHDANPPVCNRNLQENGSQELARVQPHSWSRLAFRKLRTPLNVSSNSAFQPRFPPVTRSSLLAEWSDIIKQGSQWLLPLQPKARTDGVAHLDELYPLRMMCTIFAGHRSLNLTYRL